MLQMEQVQIQILGMYILELEQVVVILRLEQIGQILNYTSTEIIEMGNQNTLILCPTIEKTTIPIQSSDSLQLSDKDLYIQFLEKRIHELKQRSQ